MTTMPDVILLRWFQKNSWTPERHWLPNFSKTLTENSSLRKKTSFPMHSRIRCSIQPKASYYCKPFCPDNEMSIIIKKHTFQSALVLRFASMSDKNIYFFIAKPTHSAYISMESIGQQFPILAQCRRQQIRSHSTVSLRWLLRCKVTYHTIRYVNWCFTTHVQWEFPFNFTTTTPNTFRLPFCLPWVDSPETFHLGTEKDGENRNSSTAAVPPACMYIVGRHRRRHSAMAKNR